MKTLLVIILAMACLSCNVAINPDGTKVFSLDPNATTEIVKRYIDHNSGK
jgi:hypothetical protein